MNTSKVFLSSLLCALTLLSSTATYAGSLKGPSDRGNNWEFSLGLDYLHSKSGEGDNGTQADFTSDSGWALGFGYHFNEHFLLAFDTSWHSPSYNGTRVYDDNTTEQISGRIDTNKVGMRGYYHFMDQRITPYVSGALGWTFVDSNIPSGDVGQSCWWDYYWGYICSTYKLTHTGTEFSYGAGLGLRMELNRTMFIRASVDKSWIDLNHAGTVDNMFYRIEMGFQSR